MAQEMEAPKTAGDRRPRIKLEELPRGRGFAIAIASFLIVVMGLFALVGGALKATGYLSEPVSEGVWVAQQKDILDQTYDEYLEAENDVDVLGGTLMMALFFPAACLLAGLLWWTAVNESVKCPKGHVTYKTYSFCPECGAQVYLKEELAPDEWAKRYGPPVGPEGQG